MEHLLGASPKGRVPPGGCDIVHWGELPSLFPRVRGLLSPAAQTHRDLGDGGDEDSVLAQEEFSSVEEVRH